MQILWITAVVLVIAAIILGVAYYLMDPEIVDEDEAQSAAISSDEDIQETLDEQQEGFEEQLKKDIDDGSMGRGI